MSRYLIVSWAGSGNLVPTLGICRALVVAGHDVRVLSHSTTGDLFTTCGARFRVFTQDWRWDATAAAGDPGAEVRFLIEDLCFSTQIAGDVGTELERESADVVLADCMLFTALNVAQASGARTATLFHTPYSILRGGPLVEMFAAGIEICNAHRARIGLDPIVRLGDTHDACDVALVAVPAEFEPNAGDAANVVRIGPVLDAPALVPAPDSAHLVDGPEPLVLVSLSTSEQGQAALLQRCVDAVAQLPVRAMVTTGPAIDTSSVHAGPNTQVVSYVPHADVLPKASLVITHAGLGTTMAALGHGVPMVCVPMGRDQFFNAEQVQRLHAGRMLMPDVDANTIADAARHVLADESHQAAAHSMATKIASYGGCPQAVQALERIPSNR
jgi:UDP:flavonoid glycosyltransferase YjiC (YdhE family)